MLGAGIGEVGDNECILDKKRGGAKSCECCEGSRWSNANILKGEVLEVVSCSRGLRGDENARSLLI